ncbi:CDP-alcohol phosphatidyltransferase family protein [Nitratireductor basaltis]|uniref:CDP-alcohol phosphatidyltransferase n=1 Tax=Nitratireductor basaltis TaxID=472175 RepID=A0A084UE19_9HYPH|nr:CDP-alcohol phosphatidyltransferase family protein [Nitratireductor basaltis]KFB11205.1 hypothetical protein EL18_02250 [Nitratireductor basaltis]
MIDGIARRGLDPLLQATASLLARARVSANVITWIAFGTGLAAAAAIISGYFITAFLLILLSRLGDGLDGAVARINGKTDLGGYLDIVLDFVFYGAIPLAFILHDPAANAVPGAVLLFAFYANGASFLAFSIMAEKRKMSGEARGEKSFFFTTGLAEAGETLIAFSLACFMPQWFAVIAYIFAAMTIYTTISRIALAMRDLR